MSSQSLIGLVHPPFSKLGQTPPQPIVAGASSPSGVPQTWSAPPQFCAIVVCSFVIALAMSPEALLSA
jgi:hypothetical protein